MIGHFPSRLPSPRRSFTSAVSMSVFHNPHASCSDWLHRCTRGRLSFSSVERGRLTFHPQPPLLSSHTSCHTLAISQATMHHAAMYRRPQQTVTVAPVILTVSACQRNARRHDSQPKVGSTVSPSSLHLITTEPSSSVRGDRLRPQPLPQRDRCCQQSSTGEGSSSTRFGSPRRHRAALSPNTSSAAPHAPHPSHLPLPSDTTPHPPARVRILLPSRCGVDADRSSSAVSKCAVSSGIE